MKAERNKKLLHHLNRFINMPYIHLYPFFSISCSGSFFLFFIFCTAIQYHRHFYRHRFNNRHTHAFAHSLTRSNISSLCATTIPIAIHLLRTTKKLIYQMNWVSNRNNESQQRRWCRMKRRASSKHQPNEARHGGKSSRMRRLLH